MSDGLAQAERGATRVAIVGLGAIGGSAALQLIQRGVTPSGYDVLDEDRRLAAAAGVHVHDALASAVGEADLVLISVPLDRLAEVALAVVKHCPREATVLHTASLQRPDATRLPAEFANRIIGTHPLAGTALAGFAAANAELFRGATVFVEDRATRGQRDDADRFWSMAGASRIRYLPAKQHDDLMAAVSHVPQIVATALASTLAVTEGVRRSDLGPGGRDMTRLGASSWEMWRPLLAGTPGRTLAMLEAIASELTSIRAAVESGDLREVEITWSVARTWALEERTK